MEVDQGRKDVAADILRRAIEGGGTVAPIAAVRLASDLVNRGRPGAADVLRPIALEHLDDAEVQSAFALALGAAGSHRELAIVEKRALACVRRCAQPLTAARSWQRLAVTAHFTQRWMLARERCASALEIASEHGFDGVEARTRSLLFNIAFALDEPEGVVAEAGLMVQAARRCGARQIELAGLSELFVEAAETGNDALYAETAAALEGLGPIRGYASAFPHAFARALGETWSGNHVTAIAILNRIVHENDESPDAVMCADALATAIAIASDAANAKRYVQHLRVASRPSRLDPRALAGHNAVVTLATRAIIEAAHGQRGLALRAAREANRIATTRRERGLARAMHDAVAADDQQRWTQMLDSLRNDGLSGYARLFAHVVPKAAAVHRSVLTPREREILQLYAQRRQAKEIAASLDVHVATVHTHIKNGLRKLRLHGREALIAAGLDL